MNASIKCLTLEQQLNLRKAEACCGGFLPREPWRMIEVLEILENLVLTENSDNVTDEVKRRIQGLRKDLKVKIANRR